MQHRIKSPYVLAGSDPILGRPDDSPQEPLPPCDDLAEKPPGGFAPFLHPYDSPLFLDPFRQRSFSDSNVLDDMTPPLTMSDLSSSPAALFLSSFSPIIDVPVAFPDDEGQTVAGNVLGPVVGQGGFSTIRTGTSPSGDIVAIKIVRRSDVSSQPNPEVEARRLDHEAQVWSSLHHEHTLPLFKHEHTSFADYFVTLYCPAGSLYDILKRNGRPGLPHDDAGMMFRQVVRGLQYMHDIGYVHGDIKLENILVDEMGICKVADFGMTRRIGETEPTEFDQPEHEHPTPLRRHTKIGLTAHHSLIRHKTTDPARHVTRHRNSTPLRDSSAPQPRQVYQQGSLPYASPELLLPNGGSPYVPHPAQDIWALGVMLYGLLTGRLPFMDPFDPRLQMKILQGTFEMPVGIGPAAERVLAGCLDANVASRWTIAMVDEDAWGIGWASHESSPASDLGSDCDPINIPNRTRTISDAVSDSESLHNSCSVVSEESLLPGRGSSSSSSSSRSRSSSRLPHPLHYVPASLSSLTDSILGNETTGNSLNSTTLARGRPRTKISPERADSRSLSPSMAPLTPPDLLCESSARSRRLRAYGPDSPLENEGERTRGTSRFRWRGPDLFDIEETSTREKWRSSGSRHSSRSRLPDDDCLHGTGRKAFDLLNQWDETPRGRSPRAGSQSARSSLSTSREKRLCGLERDLVGWRTPSATRDGVREAVAERIKVRSRSVGFDFGVKRTRTRHLAPP